VPAIMCQMAQAYLTYVCGLPRWIQAITGWWKRDTVGQTWRYPTWL